MLLKLDRSPHSIQHHRSTNSPAVHQLFIFRLHSIGLTQKHLLCSFFWYFWCEEREVNRSHALSSFLFSLKRHMIYSFNCSCSLNVSRTKQNWNIWKSLRFVGCVWGVVSLLFMFSFCFVFVGLVCNRPHTVRFYFCSSVIGCMETGCTALAVQAV